MSFQNLHTVKRSHDTLLIEMENSNLQLKEEQNKSLALQNELKLGSSNQQKLVEVIFFRYFCQGISENCTLDPELIFLLLRVFQGLG